MSDYLSAIFPLMTCGFIFGAVAPSLGWLLATMANVAKLHLRYL